MFLLFCIHLLFKFPKLRSNDTSVYAVEPVGKKLQRNLESGREMGQDRVTVIPTIADGIRVRMLGEKNFAEVVKYCEKQVFTVVSVFSIKYDTYRF